MTALWAPFTLKTINCCFRWYESEIMQRNHDKIKWLKIRYEKFSIKSMRLWEKERAIHKFQENYFIKLLLKIMRKILNLQMINWIKIRLIMILTSFLASCQKSMDSSSIKNSSSKRNSTKLRKMKKLTKGVCA